MYKEIPQAVREAIARKFDALDLTEEIMASLRWDSLNDVWYFDYAGMLHGVENDGWYIHT
jgi:hypothetical protein